MNKVMVLSILTGSLLGATAAAHAGQLTLSTYSGGTGTSITISGSGFYPNATGYVFFDQNFDYEAFPPSDPGSGWCGTYSDEPCEPRVNVATDSQGRFTASLSVPPGKNVDFLGAGTYQIGAELPIGGSPEGLAPFVVPAAFTISPTGPTGTGVWAGKGLERVTVHGSNFAPYRLNGNQSLGYVWVDYNNNFLLDSGEASVQVAVLPDGSLSACASSSCAITVLVRTEVQLQPLQPGVYIRANISHEADFNRSTQAKIEASALFGGRRRTMP